MIFVIVVVLHDGLVHKGVLVTISTSEPIINGRNDDSDVVRFHKELGIVGGITTLIKVRVVNKVPAILPAVTFTLYLVGEGGAFNEGVFTFEGGNGRVLFFQDLKSLFSTLKCIWTVLRESFISNSCDYRGVLMIKSLSYLACGSCPRRLRSFRTKSEEQRMISF